jgi:squalene synthase HpnC/squalene synthase HpnD
MAFSDDLRRFGPGASDRLSRDEALEYCARLTSGHYENFSVVTWLTPREHRPAFQSIYAFCRWSDDLGDEVSDAQRSLELLSWWRGELRAMYRGETRHPIMIALSETVERYAIPIEPFELLISAFEQDQTVSEYSTFEQLLEYCRRSANPVGHLVLCVAGANSPENVRLADATCTALQLANFWQDVARDLTIGRIYLPREDRSRFGYSESDLRSLRFTPEFSRLLKFEIDRTRNLFAEGRLLVSRIPRAFAIDVDLFSRGGLAILDAIEARGFDVLSARPSLSRWTKVRLLGRAVAALGMAAMPTSRTTYQRPAAADQQLNQKSRRNHEEPATGNRKLTQSYRFCAALSRRNARNFYYAFLLLPESRRRSMCALYAFFRQTDDLVDDTAAPTQKAERIAAWRVELGAVLAGGRCEWPGFPALADTVARHEIPAHFLHDVINGVAMDVQPRCFATFADLADYCYHVASVVGLCCLHIWGYRSEGGKAEQLAQHCGIALQLTNIIRDVREDARNGRIYLPAEDLAAFGVSPEELAASGPPSSQLRALLAFQTQRAFNHYQQARPLELMVAPVGRPVLVTIVGIYRALLDEIVNRNYNVMDGRVSVPQWRKTAIALRALTDRFAPSGPGWIRVDESRTRSEPLAPPR